MSSRARATSSRARTRRTLSPVSPSSSRARRPNAMVVSGSPAFHAIWLARTRASARLRPAGGLTPCPTVRAHVRSVGAPRHTPTAAPRRHQPGAMRRALGHGRSPPAMVGELEGRALDRRADRGSSSSAPATAACSRAARRGGRPRRSPPEERVPKSIALADVLRFEDVRHDRLPERVAELDVADPRDHPQDVDTSPFGRLQPRRARRLGLRRRAPLRDGCSGTEAGRSAPGFSATAAPPRIARCLRSVR